MLCYESFSLIRFAMSQINSFSSIVLFPSVSAYLRIALSSYYDMLTPRPMNIDSNYALVIKPSLSLSKSSKALLIYLICCSLRQQLTLDYAIYYLFSISRHKMKPKSLSIRGIPKVIQSDQEAVILQILNNKQVTSRQNEYFMRCQISDGYAFMKAIIYKQAIQKVQQQAKKGKSICFAVVQISKHQYAKEKKTLIIENMSIIYDTVNSMIGSPIPIRQYTALYQKNLKGSNLIPINQNIIPKISQPPKTKPTKQTIQPINQPINPPTSLQRLQKPVKSQSIIRQQPKKGAMGRLQPKMSDLVFIGALHPDMEGWKIIGRVTVKTQPKEIKTRDQRLMKVFSFNLVGEDNYQIKCSMFDKAIDRFYPFIEENQVYFISGGKVRLQNYPNKSSQFKPSNFSITINQTSQIQPGIDDGSIPKVIPCYVDLEDLKKFSNQTICVRGIVNDIKSKGYQPNFVTRAGKPLKRKVICICDPKSQTQVQLTLWNQLAQKFAYIGRSVIQVSQCRVNQYMGNLNLATTQSTRITTLHNDPLIEYLSCVQEGKFMKLSSDMQREKDLSPVLSNLNQLNTKLQLLQDGKQLQTQTCLYLKRVITKGTKWYPSCQFCKKKVDQSSEQCMKCHKNIVQPRFRYILTVEVADSFGSIYVTVFDEAAQKLFAASGKALPCNVAKQLAQNEFQERVKQICSKQYKMKISSKYEMGSNGRMKKHTVARLLEESDEIRSKLNIDQIKIYMI